MTAPPLDLRALLTDPGFTPGALHFAALADELKAADRERATELERVLARGGERALGFVLETLPHADPKTKAHLIGVLGRLADSRAARALREALADGDARVVRRAANALGKLDFDPRERSRAPCALARSGRHPQTHARRSARQKVGGARSRAAGSALTPATTRSSRASQAKLGSCSSVARRAARPHGFGSMQRCPRPALVLARCRKGLTRLLCDEARAARSRTRALGHRRGAPFCRHARRALGGAHRTRLRVSRFRCQQVTWQKPSRQRSHRRKRAPCSRLGRRDPCAFRLSFAAGGHQRALVFRIAERAAALAPDMVNDPREANWELVVAPNGGAPELVLVPTGFDDPRFAYRRREVRAASHPTLAAALARAAAANADDRVVGSFRGAAGSTSSNALGSARTVGSAAAILDPEALRAAEANLASAGVAAELREATRPNSRLLASL